MSDRKDGQAEVLLAVPAALRAMAENAEHAIQACSAERVVELERELIQRRREADRAEDLIRELRRQMVPLGRQSDGYARVRRLLAEHRAYCSAERLDVPHWINSVQAALDGAP